MVAGGLTGEPGKRKKGGRQQQHKQQGIQKMSRACFRMKEGRWKITRRAVSCTSLDEGEEMKDQETSCMSLDEGEEMKDQETSCMSPDEGEEMKDQETSSACLWKKERRCR